jgi:hypothetical protein
MRVPATAFLEGARRVIDHARPRLARTLALGVLCAGSSGIACSSSAIGTGSADEQGSPPNAGETPDETDDAPLDPRAPGASVFCGMGGKNLDEPEIYMLYAMNRKLQMYPEFAKAAGLSLVTDCNGGRRYFYEYAKYRLEHGEFDADQELGELPNETAELPSGAPPTLETQKIHNGRPATNDAVVRIKFKVPAGAHPAWRLTEGSTTCSGTFINKNWILTAAHCLTYGAIIDCLKKGEAPAQCEPSWVSYGTYTISGTRQGTSYTLNDVQCRQYVHGDWAGEAPAQNPVFCPGGDSCLPSNFADHDIGLLYVNQGYDDQLQPNVEAGAALRLSIVPTDPLWPNAFYGYGNPGAPFAPLRSGGPRHILSVSRHTIVGDISDVNEPFLCRGDSGGPLVRTGLSLVTNLSTGNQVKTGIEAIFGVASRSSGADCRDLTSPVEHDTWARVDSKSNRRFIAETVRRLPPYTLLNFQQRPLGTPQQPPRPPEVEELWGKPCADQSVCKKDAANKKYIETCWHAPDYFATKGQTSCEACAPAAGCGCIVGQCIPNTP